MFCPLKSLENCVSRYVFRWKLCRIGRSGHTATRPAAYWFYVAGWIPAHKDPRQVDDKLIAKYDIDLTRTTRARRKRLGQANMRYLRHGRSFVLLATHGRHPFFDEESDSIRDFRHVPLRFAGYSISYRHGGRKKNGERDTKWHSHIEIARDAYKELEAYFLSLAVRRSAAKIAREFYRLPFEPYAPIRRQMLKLVDKVNRARKKAGHRPIPYRVLPMRRRVVKPFEPSQIKSTVE